MNMTQILLASALTSAVANARAGQDSLSLDEIAKAISEGITDPDELRLLGDSLYDQAEEIEDAENDEDEDQEEE